MGNYDFTGFNFDGYDSSTLGITRVSGGDRYGEDLQPEIKDRTAEVPGLNGEYFFGSDYGTRTFDLEIAFDSLKEVQLRKLRTVFGTKEIKKLIFNERPYKYYMVKLANPIELSYVCFDEPKKTIGAAREGVRRITRIEEEIVINEETHEPVIDEETGEPITQSVIYRDIEQVIPYETLDTTERIYKGEGKISFIAYYPFAKSAYKQLPSEDEESDWAISSGILSATARETNSIDEYVTVEGGGIINVYNAGDVETGFCLYLPAAVCGTATTLTYKEDNSTITAQLILNAITLKDGDVGVLIDTNNQLVVGVSNFENNQNTDGIYTTSGNLYNEYVNSGYFFHLEPNTLLNPYSIIEITGGGSGIYIFYDYLYF